MEINIKTKYNIGDEVYCVIFKDQVPFGINMIIKYKNVCLIKTEVENVIISLDEKDAYYTYKLKYLPFELDYDEEYLYQTQHEGIIAISEI